MMDRDNKQTFDDLALMTADIVSAYVGHNSVAATDLPDLIKSTFKALSELEKHPDRQVELELKPAVAIKRSIQPDFIVCLEDGKKLKMLKRYLRTQYKMTPEDYRRKWGLPADYPMVAPNYSKQRSKFAKNIGLGQRN
jgi:predicted transcriptional regulator